MPAADLELLPLLPLLLDFPELAFLLLASSLSKVRDVLKVTRS